MQTVRLIAGFLCSIIAAFFLILGVASPFLVHQQVQRNLAYERMLGTAATQALRHLELYGTLPSDDDLRTVAMSGDLAGGLTSLTLQNTDCGAAFHKAPEDRVVVSFWRGEWYECYAAPSGRTTLVLSFGDYLTSSIGRDILVYWIIAVGAAWAARLVSRSSRIARN